LGIWDLAAKNRESGLSSGSKKDKNALDVPIRTISDLFWKICGTLSQIRCSTSKANRASDRDKEFLMKHFVLASLVSCLALGIFGPGAAAQTFPYDHIHLNAPDPAAAANWYEKYFGGRRITEAPDRLMFGSTRLLFLKKDDAKPSNGSAIDDLSFSFPNVDAKLKEFKAGGVKIVTPTRKLPGLYKAAFVEDPWGTRIEIVQDPALLGLHHIQMVGPDPEEVFSWMLAKFGGHREKLKGKIDGIKYSSPGFSDVWILVQQGNPDPSEGHAIDHIGWRSTGSLTQTIDGLRAKGVTVTSEPRPLSLPNGPAINYSYVAGPAGAKIEIVERPGLKPGE
jgi:catechol 2,3-dioxygenase-like lactoylglutathione lyase family enzyme